MCDIPGGSFSDRDERIDFRKQCPISFSASYAFAADETVKDSLKTKGSDTFDFQGFYSVNDRLTVGAMARWLVTDDGFSLGPLADVLVLQETATTPRVSVGGYWLFGEGHRADRRANVYVAASKELPLLFDSGLIRRTYVHVGAG